MKNPTGASKNSHPATCPRCKGARLIPHPHARASDNLPAHVACPRCGGRSMSGTNSPRPPGVPQPSTLPSDAEIAREDILHRTAKGKLTIAEAHQALDDLEAEGGPTGAPLTRPACFESRGPLRHEVVAEMDAITLRVLERETSRSGKDSA